MTTFATADQLAARLGLAFTSPETTRATTLLTLASGIIQDETKQQIALVEDDTLTVRSVFGDRYRLPERPVINVSSVTITPQGGEGTVIGADTYYVDGDELVRASFPIRYQQFFADWTRGWLGSLYTVEIVYSHGFAVIPPIVQAVTLEMCVRVWSNPNNVAREAIAGVSTVYDNVRFSPSGLVMTDGERQAVNEAVKRTQGTITLR